MAAGKLRFVAERREGAFRITAMEGRASVGHIGAMRDRAGIRHDGDAVMRIGRIDVVPGARRQGVATKLYERAARLSCAEFGAPLASDVHREVGSEGFWRKQHQKGRATCYGPRAKDYWNEAKCDQYILSCPAPRSLAGARRRRHA